MALGCGAKCAKGVLIAFNVVFWLSGAAMLGIGIYFLVDTDKVTLYRLYYTDGDYALIQYLAYGLIGVGGLVFVVGFFGCCGAVRESKCMLLTYFVFLFLILGCEIAVGILAVIFKNKVIKGMEDNVTSKLKNKYGMDETITESIDLAQTKFGCCGVKEAKDYDKIKWKLDNLGQGDNVSKTCCVLKNHDDIDAFKNPKPVNETLCQSQDLKQNVKFRHQKGCLEKLEEFIRAESTLLLGIGCGIASLQVFGMVFAICLCREI
ncbi:CD9 antigen-like isoform X2 [Limulus polyphemus]|nr:CD9 antigen-like isoform X2 [Limulus polyphemus]XP_022243470.1 CD9 antigen-like isoform X2 [Limulus polyphemus]